MSERCKEKVYSRGWGFGSCSRKAKIDGYCKQHHPDAVKARREAADAKYKARWAEEVRLRKLRAAKFTLAEEACKLNDPPSALLPYIGKVKELSHAPD